jgi:hypothetical protein
MLILSDGTQRKTPWRATIVIDAANALSPGHAKDNHEDFIMRTISMALLALSFVGVTAVSAPVPAQAQGIFVGPHGVEITTRPYRHRHARYERYYNNQSYAYSNRGYNDGRYYRSYGYSSPYAALQDRNSTGY